MTQVVHTQPELLLIVNVRLHPEFHKGPQSQQAEEPTLFDQHNRYNVPGPIIIATARDTAIERLGHQKVFWLQSIKR